MLRAKHLCHVLRFEFLLAFAFLILAPSLACGQSFTATVVDVKDGDTIEIQRADGSERTIRFHGVDTPETGQPYGREATDYVVGRALKKTVTIRVVDEDRYGRLAAQVEMENGTDLNAQLVRRRLAWWYEDYASRGS